MLLNNLVNNLLEGLARSHIPNEQLQAQKIAHRNPRLALLGTLPIQANAKKAQHHEKIDSDLLEALRIHLK